MLAHTLDITCTLNRDAILPPMDDLVKEAAEAILAGKLVGMPTETVYGLAADASSQEAVLAIFAAKNRPHFDPLIVHVSDIAMAEDCALINELAHKLMKAFWPGPLTLVLPKRDYIPDEVSSGLDTVALRCPNHPLALALIEESKRPIAAPSANLFGRISPTTAEHVREQLGDSLACIIDGGPSSIGVESTVIGFDAQKTVYVLRPGGLSVDALSEVLGYEPSVKSMEAVVAEDLNSRSPGLLKSHYAPQVPVRIKGPADEWPTGKEWGCLAFQDAVEGVAHNEILSANGDITEAAQNLFASLRRLEASDVQQICVELVPEEGLGIAINDRLKRAAGGA